MNVLETMGQLYPKFTMNFNVEMDTSKILAEAFLSQKWDQSRGEIVQYKSQTSNRTRQNVVILLWMESPATKKCKRRCFITCWWKGRSWYPPIKLISFSTIKVHGNCYLTRWSVLQGARKDFERFDECLKNSPSLFGSLNMRYSRSTQNHLFIFCVVLCVPHLPLKYD